MPPRRSIVFVLFSECNSIFFQCPAVFWSIHSLTKQQEGSNFVKAHFPAAKERCASLGKAAALENSWRGACPVL